MKHLLSLFVATICLLPPVITIKNPASRLPARMEKQPQRYKPNDLTQAANVYEKKAEELKKLSPYTLDQMKAMLPEEIAGAKRSRFSANSAMGAAYAEGEYPINDSTEIE